ncbi:hypothetical protein E4P43_12670 [Blastococcus sp. TF02A-35]|nr:hypothetical protein E4P43_12670 [Blastococcus sp. TF02A_35]
MGGIALRGPGLVAVLVSGLMAACVAAGVARESAEPRRRSVLESALLAGAVTVVALLVLSGTAMVAGGGVAVLLVAVVGAGWGVARWLGDRRAAVVRAPQARVAPAPPVPIRPVHGLSTSALAEEWVRTGAALHGGLTPAAWQGTVTRRALLLDELERRDPAGFARWMAAGPDATDPAGFVRAEPPRTDPSAEAEAA